MSSLISFTPISWSHFQCSIQFLPKASNGMLKILFFLLRREFVRSNNGHCELNEASFDSFHLFLECSFIGKLRGGSIQLECSPREERKEHSTENKKSCFRWAWLMKWVVWKLKNHILKTEGIEGINHSNRKAVSSHHDNIDSFLCGVNRSTALQKLAPKLVNQLHYFMRCSEQNHLISKYFLRRNQRQAPLRTQVLYWRQQRRLHSRKGKDTKLTTKNNFFRILNLTLFYNYKR